MKFPIPFTKMSGTGNDFIIIDHRRKIIDSAILPAFVKAVCRRKFSVGADGLILIEDSDSADFRWQFYNGDGSVAEMCGNGARCAARYAFRQGIAPATMRFETIAGDIEAFIDITNSESVKIRLTPPEDIQLDKKLQIAGNELEVHSVNTGVPHAVVFTEQIDSVPVKEWGNAIRFHGAFAPAGTNANFVQVVSEDSLLVRTYERGVEDETLACGTGAVASAIVAVLLDKVSVPVKVTTSGGDTLVVHWDYQPDNPEESMVFLEGPANFIYDGELDAGAIMGCE
jgi:diaminopimelate epimerase